MEISNIQRVLDESGLTHFMRLEALAWNPGVPQLELRLPPREELEGGAGPGHLHGGAIGALLDTAATFALLAAGVARAPTVNYRVDLLRPAANTALRATARVRRRGRTLAVVDVEAHDDAGRLVALGRFTFVVGE
jgi:uncharacterized protein (TIGR00369 family)